MPMRVAMLASECEPWAKTGGLADVVDALARALGELDGADVETPVDVFLPRYRGVPEPASIVLAACAFVVSGLVRRSERMRLQIDCRPNIERTQDVDQGAYRIVDHGDCRE